MRTLALVLKKTPIREYDELITCYTELFGKRVFQAKSILRPTSKQAPHVGVFNLLDCSTVSSSNGGWPIMTSAMALQTYPSLKSNLAALASGYFFLEVIDMAIFENQPDLDLWKFILSELGRLEKLATKNASENVNWLANLRGRQSELAALLGYSSPTQLEEIVGSPFRSLHLLNKVLGLKTEIVGF